MTEREAGPTVPPGATGGPAADLDQTVRTAAPGPDLLTDFRIVAKLGEGSMGVVYRARQQSLDRDVALKILPPHLAANRSFVDRFIREARMSVKLDHPNIVRGVAVGEERGTYYFAMEFVDGESLDRYLKSAERLSVGDTVRIITDVARALEHAHSRNILHRDIKPANIMVTRDGRVKLADLGLAKRMDDDSDLTQLGEGAGTPSYMPLEQARNARDADQRSDIYALGATMYHLLVGKRPFSGSTAYEVFKAKEKGTYVPASTSNRQVPKTLDRIIETAMAVDPARRYQSAGELIEALEATGLASQELGLTGSPTDTPPAATPAPGSGPERATRRPAARAPASRAGWLAGGALAVVIVAAVAAWQLVGRASAPPAPATRAAPAAPAGVAARADAEPADAILARALREATSGDVARARQTLEQGAKDHPGNALLERPLAELARGVLVLFQYQTPEETSPVLPIWSADGVTLTRRDNYRFAVIPGRGCHLYVFQRDTRPSVTTIFPSKRYSPLGNPVTSGAVHWLPEDPDIKGRAWLGLDTSVGEERLFFVAVTRPLRDPDGLGQRLVGGADRVAEELARDPGPFLEAGGAAGAACFAGAGGALQSFAFKHR